MDPVPVHSAVLDYAPASASLVTAFLRVARVLAIHTVLGVIFCGLGGWAGSPHLIYDARCMIGISLVRDDFGLPTEMLRPWLDRFQHKLDLSIETSRSREVAALAIQQAPPTDASDIKTAEQLHNRLNVFNLSRTAIIVIELQGTDPKQLDSLVSACGRIAFDRLQSVGLDDATLYPSSGGPLPVNQDTRRTCITAASVSGGVLGLLSGIWRQSRRQREHLAPAGCHALARRKDALLAVNRISGREHAPTQTAQPSSHFPSQPHSTAPDDAPATTP